MIFIMYREPKFQNLAGVCPMTHGILHLKLFYHAKFIFAEWIGKVFLFS